MPGEEHYLAEGIWHHNTGKSRGVLEKVNLCLMKYPGARALIVRKTRASMTESVLVTLEEKVLPAGSPMASNTLRRLRQSYEYPNGSSLVVGGMDNPDRIMSTEYDVVAAFEATELTEDDWEKLTTRLRNGVMPYQQGIADCNPSGPSHWLNKRAEAHRMTRLLSRHEDNPMLFQKGGWTPQGERYLALLERLTGARYLRLRAGKWAAAEGLVYEEFNAATHTISPANAPHLRRHIASVDWGFTNPGVIQVWGVDGDRRMYLVHEVYRSKKLIDWWTEKAIDLQQEYQTEAFVCDPAEPSYIQQFRQSGINSIPAWNDKRPGIQAVQQRINLAADGRPRLFLVDGALREPDESLEQAKLPMGIQAEIEEYHWAKGLDGKPNKEEPVKENDHGCDAMRYAVAYLDDLAANRVEVTGESFMVIG